MESLSSYAKRFVAQVPKPDVDFVFGLSPVISIEQKTIGEQPALDRRGTIDRHRELPEPPLRDDRQAALPAHRGAGARAGRQSQILEAILRCPRDPRSSCARRCSSSTARSWTFVLTEVRKKGRRRLIVDGSG